MYGFLDGRPFWVVYLSLFAIVLARAQATYWLGRAIGAGVHRSALARRLGSRLARAERLVGRYGPPAVTVSFVTVGLQTAMNLVAGTMRMRFGRYLLAMVIGSLVWALLYSLGGLAVLAAWWHLFTTSPALAITIAVLAAAVITALVLHRRTRRATMHKSATKQAGGTGEVRDFDVCDG